MIDSESWRLSDVVVDIVDVVDIGSQHANWFRQHSLLAGQLWLTK